MREEESSSRLTSTIEGNRSPKIRQKFFIREIATLTNKRPLKGISRVNAEMRDDGMYIFLPQIRQLPIGSNLRASEGKQKCSYEKIT
jgi:hypothetical protein